MLDLEAAELTPACLRGALIEDGAIVLRNVVPEHVMRPLATTVQAMLDHYDAIPADVIQREMQFEDIGRQAIWREILSDGVHYNYDLVVFSQGRHSLFEPLRRSTIPDMLQVAWPEMDVHENFVTNVRRIFPGESVGYSDLPLQPHVDAMFHQHGVLGINFWTPLTPAGVDAPGLAVLPIGVAATKSYLEYSAEGYERTPEHICNTHHFRGDRLAPDALRGAGLADLFVRPQLGVGDMLAFTNFTIHATHIDPKMTKPRSSIEVRVLLHEIPGFAIAEPCTEQPNVSQLAAAVA